MAPKSALKAIRVDLDAGAYSQAAVKASELCAQDPKNYHAHIFLGLAREKLNEYDASEKAYESAIKIKDSDKTAWQGLVALYESQGRKRLEAYETAVERLCNIFADNEEYDRAHGVLAKYINFVKLQGSKLQYIHALQLQLPTSPIYKCVEGLVPRPLEIYLHVAELAEQEEKEFINREIGERRTRLGARIDQVTTEVKREAFNRSVLSELYQGIVDWTHDDGTRRYYEEKLLQRHYDHLRVLPSKEKPTGRDLVLKAARDMVIIKHPFELAWRITFDWTDTEELSNLDVTLLRDFIRLFPDHGFSKILNGFLYTSLSPFPYQDLYNDGDGTNMTENSEIETQYMVADHLLIMAEGLDQASGSVLAHRIMGAVYSHLGESQTVIKVSRSGLAINSTIQNDTGLKLQNTDDSLNILLATALIPHQSPRHHPEAKAIFQDILSRKPQEDNCLLGLGLILEESHDFAAAMDLLAQALIRDENNAKVRSELFWCKVQNGELAAALKGFEETLPLVQCPASRWHNLRAEVLYRIGFCEWELDPSPSARKNRNGAYSKFLASIQADMNYAPAYSSLGVYYADYKKDKKRSQRCFHKAVELSSSEIMAAERLAREFAAQGDWDLVEAIAQRVVDSGKAKPSPGSKKSGYSWPFAVLGVVEINRQLYPKSIVHFQTALRISPNDYQCWVGLGESYYSSGRYIAASRAFRNAQSLECTLPESERGQIWYSKYMMANLERELGNYAQAIMMYEDVTHLRIEEFGVSVALLQTLTESAWKAAESGFFGEATETAKRAIETGLSITNYHPNGFNLWKSIGDAFSIFSWVSNKSTYIPIAPFRAVLKTTCDITSFNVLANLDGIGENFDTLFESLLGSKETAQLIAIYSTILAFKYALSTTAKDTHAQALAWYNLGWAEYRAHTQRSSFLKEPRSNKRTGLIKAATRCFKKAIELEAGNADFWNALGVATASQSPKVAQHAFVRSLHLNERNAFVWANLGAFYLLNDDYQLANEAFTRSQSADPDHSNAWLGQGLLAMLIGDAIEARELFTHAFGLGNSNGDFAKQQYAISMFDDISTSPEATPAQLLQPLFGLRQLRSVDPSELFHYHLSSLFAERAGDLEDCVSDLEMVCSGVEAAYESTESIGSLLKYAQASADLARIQLARLEYKKAAVSAETALNLIVEEVIHECHGGLYQMIRLSAHLTAGLAFYYLGRMDESIEMFRDAIQGADNSPDVTCLLAQVLWAKGGDEERLVAREQLFECVEKYPEHVGAITLLGVIGLLDMDEDTIEAVESDLQAMRVRSDLDTHSIGKIVKLLASIPALRYEAEAEATRTSEMLKQAATSVMISPGQPQGWMALSSVSTEKYAAEMAVRTALVNIPPRGRLNAEALCQAYSLVGTRRTALSGIMVAPWSKNGWDGLIQSCS
ncbi:Translation repressor/antiviral protein Ski3 [Trichophyton interdigitale]|nr:Translation repressor/antiviral protein Ski3 [Trichophyton interdigitale]KAG5217990.1 Translation repressor/antiviral protein Ski3 [Trichophyton interdigitale]KAG8206451.1 Translation repressor/antiviral protein Ski3 [Trichophyton interdigitale]